MLSHYAIYILGHNAIVVLGVANVHVDAVVLGKETYILKVDLLRMSRCHVAGFWAIKLIL